jgi:pilus assembly protein CpaE
MPAWTQCYGGLTYTAEAVLERTVIDRSEKRTQTSAAAANSPQSVSMNSLAAVVLSGNEGRRRSLSAALAGTQAHVVKEAPLPNLDSLASVLEGECDILIVDLEGDTERALEIVETAVGSHPAVTVMVYSPAADKELLVRCMRVGAREFLSDPLSAGSLTDALVRAFVRRDEAKRQKKVSGKCLVFIGAKGGSGVTTIAANFAVALAKETRQTVALLDMDLQLGDAALTLGLPSRFSALDAFQSQERLDSELLSKLMVPHSSGVKVLAAPNEHNSFLPTADDVVRLVNLVRHDFAWIVVDAGSHYNGYAQSLFDLAEKVYLVTQVSVAELRNCHRLIARHFGDETGPALEVVLNRFAPRGDEIGEQSIAKVLMDHPRWKVPSDYEGVRQAQNNATALVLKDGKVTRAILEIARAAAGKKKESKSKSISAAGENAAGKKKLFGLF